MGFLSGGLGGIVGTVGSLIGGSMDASNSRDLAKMGYAEQRNVLQNQYQWKAADAKKAGLHPLAVIGSGSYSMSPMSVPGTDYASVLGKMGESIGDAALAFKNHEQIAAEAAWKDQERGMQVEEHKARLRESEARTSMYAGQALEATRRSATYTKPMASGNEVVKGQTDAKPMLQKFVKPDGTLTNWKPGNDYQEVHSDIPLVEFWPHIQAAYQTVRDILSSSNGTIPEPYLDRRYR